MLGHSAAVILSLTSLAVLWLAWRILRYWLLRRLAVAVVSTVFAVVYLVFPLDLLLDPILVDDLAVLMLAGWQWRNWAMGRMPGRDETAPVLSK